MERQISTNQVSGTPISDSDISTFIMDNARNNGLPSNNHIVCYDLHGPTES